MGLEGDTPTLTVYVGNLGGTMYEHGPIARWRAARAAREFIKNNPNGEIVLTGRYASEFRRRMIERLTTSPR